MNVRSIAAMFSVSVVVLAGTEATAQGTQGAGAGAAPAELEQVTVTARKREERLIDVPVSISSIGDADLRSRSAVDIRDVQYSIPGLNIQEQSPGANRIQLRGVNPGAGTGLPIVGTYVDEVGITIDQQQRDSMFPLVDIDRIEVLRGPQGTLYGEGSLAGTIRYITRNPSLTRADGFIEAGMNQVASGSDNGYRINGAVGVPVVDGRVGLRLSGGYEETPGWIDYPSINSKDVNSTERYFIRPKLYAELSDRLTVSAMYQRYSLEAESDNYGSEADGKIRQRGTKYPGSDKSDLANLVLEYDLDRATLTAASGYQKRELYFNAALGGGAIKAAFRTDYEQWNHELRLVSRGDGRFRYTVGAWARDYSSLIRRSGTFVASGAPFAPLTRVGTDPVDSNSWAVFGEVAWKLGDATELTLGGRHYEDERSLVTIVPTPVSKTAKFDAFSPKVSLQHAWSDDLKTYATVSKGFRSGGFNANLSTFGPESLWNYELGLKADMMDGRLYVDTVLYYLDYKDRQAQTAEPISPGVFTAVTRNIGEASGLGFEAAVAAELGAGLELAATLGWNDVTYDTSNAEVLKGEPFDFVSEFTGSLSLSQRIGLAADRELFWRVDYQYADEYSWKFRQVTATGAVNTLQDWRSEAQDYLNARIGVDVGSWTVALEARNLLDNRYLLLPIAPISQSREGVQATPRSIGISIRRDFGD